MSSPALSACVALRMTNAQIAWPVVLVGGADDGGLGHPGVPDERGLDLGGGDAVPGDVHHVVDAAEHPDLAVRVVAGAVAGEVPALLGEPRPVGLLEPLRVAPDAAQHRRPRLVEHQVAAGLLAVVGAGLELVAVVVDDLGRDAGQRASSPNPAWRR